MRDEKQTLDCLKKGARIASQCLDIGVQVQLYVELLNNYLFYFERGNSLITVAMLNQVSKFRDCVYKQVNILMFPNTVYNKNKRRTAEFGAVRGDQANWNSQQQYAGTYKEQNAVRR